MQPPYPVSTGDALLYVDWRKGLCTEKIGPLPRPWLYYVNKSIQTIIARVTNRDRPANRDRTLNRERTLNRDKVLNRVFYMMSRRGKIILKHFGQVKSENITPDTNCSRVEKQPTTATQLTWTGIGQFPVKCDKQFVAKFHLHPKLRLNITFLYVKMPEYFGTCRFYNITVVAGGPDKRSANPGLRNIRRKSEGLAKEFVYCGNMAQFSLYPPSDTVTQIVPLYKKCPSTST